MFANTFKISTGGTSYTGLIPQEILSVTPDELKSLFIERFACKVYEEKIIPVTVVKIVEREL